MFTLWKLPRPFSALLRACGFAWLNLTTFNVSRCVIFLQGCAKFNDISFICDNIVFLYCVTFTKRKPINIRDRWPGNTCLPSNLHLREGKNFKLPWSLFRLQNINREIFGSNCPVHADWALSFKNRQPVYSIGLFAHIAGYIEVNNWKVKHLSRFIYCSIIQPVSSVIYNCL